MEVDKALRLERYSCGAGGKKNVETMDQINHVENWAQNSSRNTRSSHIRNREFEI